MSDTQIQKLELLEWVASLQDKSLIGELIKWKEEHQHISIEQYNAEIEEADEQIESGDYLTHEEAVKEIRSWREK
jgi:predicted transcriptional regulator